MCITAIQIELAYKHQDDYSTMYLNSHCCLLCSFRGRAVTIQNFSSTFQITFQQGNKKRQKSEQQHHLPPYQVLLSLLHQPANTNLYASNGLLNFIHPFFGWAPGKCITAFFTLNYIIEMCIYQPQNVNIKCAHAECQVISTIKKINKNIFVSDRKTRDQSFFGEDEEVSGFRREEVNQIVEEGYHDVRKGLSSKRTVPSMEEIELFDRIIALEKQLKDLKEVTMTMKRKLEDNGIL